MMSARAKDVFYARLRSLAAPLSTIFLLAGCDKPSMGNGSLSMTKDDLEAVYRTYDPLHAGHQTARDVVIGDEGITVIASTDPTGDTEHLWLLKIAFDGSLKWERHYEPRLGIARSAVRSANGGLALVGEIQRSAMAFQATLVTINTNGDIEATRTLGPRGITSFASVQTDTSGSFVAGGVAPRAWLVSIDAALRSPSEHTIDAEELTQIKRQSNGDLAVLAVAERSTSSFGRARLMSLGPKFEPRWQHDLPTKEHGDPAALAVQPDGVLAVGSGAIDDRALAHVWLAFADNAGALRWERTLSAGDDDARAWAAAALPDGYAIAGETATTNGIRTPHVWRLDKDGKPRWQQGYPVPASPKGGQPFDIFTAIAVAPDGGFVIVGSTLRGPGRTNVWVVRLAPDGKLLWERIFGSAPMARG